MNTENEFFPKIFITGVMPKDYCERKACADGLCGWAMCMIGNTPPENFGKGMIKIGNLLGIVATGDNLMEYSKNNFKTKEDDLSTPH